MREAAHHHPSQQVISFMQFKDYYRILGVPIDASADDIKNAYRKLARRFHPDVNKAADAQARFVEIGEAYEALGDDSKRQAYDRIRSAGYREGQEIDPPMSDRPHQTGRARTGDQRPFSEMDPHAYSEFFKSMFGQNGDPGGRQDFRSSFSERGADFHHVLPITLEEAHSGGHRRLQMQIPEVDADGQVHQGIRTIDVTIPAGTTGGTRLRLRGQGEPGSRVDLCGDLFLDVRLSPHSVFGVDGRTILLDLTITPWHAVLGATVSVPTLGGSVSLRIPSGTRSGDKLRLRGRGLEGTPAGDQIITIRIDVPTSTTPRERELYAELATASMSPPAKL